MRNVALWRDVASTQEYSQRLKSKSPVNKVITFPSLKFNQHPNYVFNSDYVQSNELIFEVKVNFPIPFHLTSCGYTEHRNISKELIISVFHDRLHLQ